MMHLTWKTNLVAVGLFLVAGYAAGSALAGEESDDAGTPKLTSTSGPTPAQTAPLAEIGDGQTVGHWGPDTPVKDRPDFYPVALDDGTPGFVKRTDIDDELVLPILPPGEVGKVDPGAMAAALHKQRHVMVQPNSKGEIWVDVYSEDAKTIIGRKLMDNVNE